MKLAYLRGGKSDVATVELGTVPGDNQVASRGDDAPSGQARLGLSLAPANDAGLGDKGVTVMDVDPDGPAAAKGIAQGDVILDVGGTSVSKPSDVQAQIRAAESSGRKAVLMRVKSARGQTRFIAVPLSKEG